MTLRVTNTLSGEREDFEPQDPEDVLLYYCGLTTSDPPHLGHARGWVHVDVMHRWLSWLGYTVHHVENFTDVNEKIVARVGEAGSSEADVARTYIEDVIRDMRSLNLKRAEVYPRVSEHVPEIIDLVETLIDREYAYEANGSVYFDVTAFEDYGDLSNQTVDELDAQGDPDERGEKRHPQDFALWKAGGVDPSDVETHQHEGAAPPETACETAQTWDSPWGEGRPGWHVECSAMSMTHLGETLDIHVGGQDLVFPHHENEVAQSEAATGQRFANYWLHVGLLETGDEKMSSSLGNFATVEEAIAEYGLGVVRTFLLSTAYHSRATYTEETLSEARERYETLERGYERAVEAVDSADATVKTTDDALREAVETAREEIPRAMNDDFNTRKALAALVEFTTAVNRHVDESGTYDYRGLRRAIETYDEFAVGVLGLPLGDDGDDTGDVRLAEDLVELVLDVREAERDAGNYERADELRDELAALGVEVEDSDGGPTYRLP
ncbi:Cysteine--tRNA ligase protein [Halorhabdus tiamatea SARL4B]|uniref:Cysteine--tRNA ligase n=1 Tax=Halorhabdus tiamatea SARL4B TaxID=1033806 RepID=F7PIK0_9EURY|nr:cysteine--tRNA ligase [Halorhabdus tiamatea]ERJ05266.1 Cysteine--tRNA ligase protein [Halorhabdus tiamatea SARL4B]CCQ32163.1 cysteinyl-tRNA synthetase [Halorhabdus tiamatea SARL4B]